MERNIDTERKKRARERATEQETAAEMAAIRREQRQQSQPKQSALRSFAGKVKRALLTPVKLPKFAR
ncbi:MAG TPA: hypothetical protein VK571_00975 [Gemmatimonadaceae bacterium]|nr:hypothetical protein [Gemmatimonadaceae bacterium]